MSNIKTMKCSACGSSDMKRINEIMLECSYCGTKSMIKDDSFSKDEKLKRKNLPYIIVIIMALLIVILIFILSLGKNKDEKKVTKQTSLSKQSLLQVNNLDSANQPVSSVDSTRQSQPKISVISSVQGQTSLGGIYWIVRIRNDSDQTVARAKVVVSLFYETGLRIEEQSGWAKRELLQPAQETTVLVFIESPPQSEFKTEMSAQAQWPGRFQIAEQELTVTDYVVKEEGKNRYTIIGDVFNPNKHQVDFVKVVAIAMDETGQSVGIADAFATTSKLPAGQQSGFKINVGTFLAKKPVTWLLWSKGRQHRE